MSNYESVDFFTDESILEDPYPYYEHLRAKCPVEPTGHHRVIAVTGYDEATQVYADTENFSACNVVAGPFSRFPVPLDGDDVSDIIARYRDHIPANEHMVTMDPPMHTRERGLIMRLMTPRGLAQNESFIWRLADQQLDEFVKDGRCEFISAFAQPFSMLVIADLLGVPEADHERFREGFGLQRNDNFSLTGPPDEDAGGPPQYGTSSWLYDWFVHYIEERRRHPKNDVMTQMAQAKYPDGSTPEAMTVAEQAGILFGSGRETTARLLGAGLNYMSEYPELQDELRAHRERIPDFVEECLRMESPIKADFRMAKRTTTLAGVEIKAGTPVVIFNGAANRDPGRFECPAEFRVDRANSKEHMAFGRGVHSCPGAALARAEGRIAFERILARMRDIRLSEGQHGPVSARHYNYESSWLLRALHELHLEFTPVES